MNQSELERFLRENKSHFNDSVRLFIEWNEQREFQTRAFDWLYSNAMLLAGIESKPIVAVVQAQLNERTYIDVLSYFKDEEERKHFLGYTNIIPLFS
ncbi:hypothetical protein JOC54_000328 [Alkalihalobacillus xiaoxiensis]|uniref:Uncharacterized protein n=1 Tax=Shouchella xiaoxiensis TaxID=766895 RepID=A0ABS2SNK5_9BACI|nr:hypothetical protein [Shouchella xiaoxiensis]MBM7837097.1 hypothetical protein [Shouchella xiaoxiensis]